MCLNVLLPLLLEWRLSAFGGFHLNLQSMIAMRCHVEFKVCDPSHCTLLLDDCASDGIPRTSIGYGVEKVGDAWVLEAIPPHTSDLQVALNVSHILCI